jgi:hypothetical protein
MYLKVSEGSIMWHYNMKPHHANLLNKEGLQSFILLHVGWSKVIEQKPALVIRQIII